MHDPPQARGPKKTPPAGLLALSFILLAVAGALAIRMPALDLRPMHGDEANQAVKAGALLDDGFYQYDPLDHHGPSLYYLSLISARLAGQTRFRDTSEVTYRMVSVVFGVALVLLLLLLRDGMGERATCIAALLLALSPAMVFYSRYFIQEMLLVCFTLGAIVAGWRYTRRPSLAWALATGACLGLMHATKETCVIAYVSMAGAILLTLILSHGRREMIAHLRRAVKPAHAIPAFILAAVISIVLFSSFFTHPRGPLDSLLTYANYLQRADGAGLHDKPWYYYLQTLLLVHRRPGPWWTEGFVMALALVGAVAAWRGRTRDEGHAPFVRFIAFYTLIMTALYSAIPYKTPWTLLSLYLGMILLAGVGASALLSRVRAAWGRVVLSILLAAGTAHLGYQAYAANYVYPADPRNPYVYAHTSTAFLRLAERIEDIAEIHPEGHGMLIKVIQPDRDYWPLPWYLRQFENVGYWHEPPDNLDASIIIASPALGSLLEEKLQGEYQTEMHGLRPSVLRAVYIRKDLWEAFIKTRM